MDINETNEDTPSMTTSTTATTDGGPSKKGSYNQYNQGDNWKIFDVDTDCFEKFRSGRKKFERWARFLNMDNETHKSIYDYASKHSKNTIVLRCSESGALRAIRRRSSNGL
jgi:hypothetical protein